MQDSRAYKLPACSTGAVWDSVPCSGIVMGSEGHKLAPKHTSTAGDKPRGLVPVLSPVWSGPVSYKHAHIHIHSKWPTLRAGFCAVSTPAWPSVSDGGCWTAEPEWWPAAVGRLRPTAHSCYGSPSHHLHHLALAAKKTQRHRQTSTHKWKDMQTQLELAPYSDFEVN